MSVLMQDTGRGDIALTRGTTNRWGVLWETSADGATFAPVDVSAWTGVLELRSPMGEVWLSEPVVTSLTGLTTMTLTPAHLSGEVWAGRAGGTWAVNLTSPDGRVERLAQGYFHLEA